MIKKFLFTSLKVIALLIAFSTFIFYITSSSIEKQVEIKKKVTMGLEEAYFEGQRDFLNGKIRIKKNDDNSYSWINGGPWEGNTTTLWNP